MVNYEIKSQLAKLLATEDLVVENRNSETASFDVENRVLTLPMWEKASSTVYDMLVGHEVGHALFTPDDWSWEKRVPRSFVNITEDARIEKLMKRKYPGLTKTFYRAYKDLSEEDFFELSDVNISEMNLADRINLKYKIGNWVDIPFTDEEMELVELVGKSETFGEAVLAAEEVYRYTKEQLNTQTPLPNLEEVVNTSQDQEKGEKIESEETEESNEQTLDTPEMENEDHSEGESIEQQPQEIEPEVTTDDIFSENVSELNRPSNLAGGNSYYEIPKLNYNDIVVSNSEIHEMIGEYWTIYQENEFEEADTDYSKFKKSAQKEVNYLVKEFECKKSADSYARTTTSRTGVLDCTKLHTYKYNEDLFKKVNVIPDGKNHGLVFILDWSGSMCDSLLDTIKQLYNLVWFCSKVNIPFDVYAFSNTYNREHRDCKYYNDMERGKLAIGGDFKLMHFLNSKVNKKTLDNQLLNIWRIARQFRIYSLYNNPSKLSLSGTPLNESLVSLHSILPKFKKENQLQKVQCVILTDGEAHQLNYFDYYTGYYDEKEQLGPRQCRAMNGYLRNRKTGHTYQIGYQYWNFTDVLLEDLKRSFPDTNFIGIRLVAPRDFSTFLRRYGFLSELDLKKARKEKSYNIQGSGYDAYFAMIQNSLSSDTEFEVEDEASKTKIKSAFMKSLKAKSLNKKVLSQFMDLVC